MRKFLFRDLSWLQFNLRVLLEAKSDSVPIFERLRFLAIYSANLDEFFRVRVGSLRNLKQLGKQKINRDLEMAPSRLLKLIQSEVNRQLVIYGKCWRKVLRELKKEGIELYSGGTLSVSQQVEIAEYFSGYVAAFLNPYLTQKKNGKPFLNNGTLYFGVKLQRSADDGILYSYVNIPSDQLGRFHRIHAGERRKHLYFLIDDVVKMHLDKVYPGYRILECKEVKVSRNADFQIEDEFAGDLVRKIRKQLKRRNLGSTTRFLYDQTMSADMLDWFRNLLDLSEDDLYPGGTTHNLNDYLSLPNPVGRSLEYPEQPPLRHPEIKTDGSLLESVIGGDILLHFPYQRYAYVLRFFNEAAIHPDVKEIQAVFYRMASGSLIGEALVSAAKNGKRVIVFMEIKARFDEENNLRWAMRFKQAGIKVIYSIPGLKVHAKVALIKAGKKSTALRDIGFFGTGNLNEKTARVYSDYALFTSNHNLTGELANLFYYLSTGKLPPVFNHLLVSHFNIIPSFTALIERAMSEARRGKKVRIFLKINNLEEKRMISSLYEASQEGVEIRLIVRGVCCLRPQVDGLSGNIRVKRLVDRYLEHSRVFIFYYEDGPVVYLGSADWMNRNLHHRIEVVFPVYDNRLKAQIIWESERQWLDNIKSYELSSEGKNIAPRAAGARVICAQQQIYKRLGEVLKAKDRAKDR